MVRACFHGTHAPLTPCTVRTCTDDTSQSGVQKLQHCLLWLLLRHLHNNNLSTFCRSDHESVVVCCCSGLSAIRYSTLHKQTHSTHARASLVCVPFPENIYLYIKIKQWSITMQHYRPKCSHPVSAIILLLSIFFLFYQFTIDFVRCWYYFVFFFFSFFQFIFVFRHNCAHCTNRFDSIVSHAIFIYDLFYILVVVAVVVVQCRLLSTKLTRTHQMLSIF